MTVHDPLVDYVVLEYSATVRVMLHDQPQRDFDDLRSDDARAALADRIADALVELEEAVEVAVGYPLRGGGQAIHGRGEASSTGLGGPFSPPVPPGDQ